MSEFAPIIDLAEKLKENLEESGIEKDEMLDEIDELVQKPLELATRAYEEDATKGGIHAAEYCVTCMADHQATIHNKLIEYLIDNHCKWNSSAKLYKLAFQAKIQDIHELFNMYFKKRMKILLEKAEEHGMELEKNKEIESEVPLTPPAPYKSNESDKGEQE